MYKLRILLFTLITISLLSCKKDRVCTCGIETSSGVIVTETTLYDVTKREGRNNCIGSQTVTKTAQVQQQATKQLVN